MTNRQTWTNGGGDNKPDNEENNYYTRQCGDNGQKPVTGVVGRYQPLPQPDMFENISVFIILYFPADKWKLTRWT